MTKLMGGLGNQLFQLAAGMYVAEHAKSRLCLDVSFFENNKCHDGFCLPEILNLEKIGIEVSRGTSRLAVPIKVRESKGAIDRAVWFGGIIPNWMGLQLRGYWQIASLAEAMRDVLMDSLHPIEEQFSDCIFLHFRRGDYVIGANKDLHDVLPSSYYSEGISFLLSRFDNCPILVVSDDLEYAKSAVENLPSADYRFIDFEDSFSTFRAMTTCRGAICANSSFSWWAAFFQANRKCWVLPQTWDAIHPELAYLRHPSGSVQAANTLVVLG